MSTGLNYICDMRSFYVEYDNQIKQKTSVKRYKNIVKEIKKKMKISDISIYKWLKDLTDEEIIITPRRGFYKLISFEESKDLSVNSKQLDLDTIEEILE